eukprot:12897080-Prorocentrum_lima.AAC.1
MPSLEMPISCRHSHYFFPVPFLVAGSKTVRYYLLALRRRPPDVRPGTATRHFTFYQGSSIVPRMLLHDTLRRS